jgi:hypothetical protein
VTRQIIAMIRDSGASAGDLVYVRASRELPIPGARLVTDPDLLRLKAEALECDSPLIATGPPTDEHFADIVIDADRDQPIVIKRRSAGRGSGGWRPGITGDAQIPSPDPGIV